MAAYLIVVEQNYFLLNYSTGIETANRIQIEGGNYAGLICHIILYYKKYL